MRRKRLLSDDCAAGDRRPREIFGPGCGDENGERRESRGGDPACSFDTTDAGHVDVHEDEVRPKLGRQRDGLLPGRRLADQLEARRGANQLPRHGEETGLVVRREHPYHRIADPGPDPRRSHHLIRMIA